VKVILIVTLMLMGQEKPAQRAAEIKDLKTCEVEAHKFMTHKFPDEVGKIVFRSAACAYALPGKDA
jgi:hypothetical protein